MNKREKLKELFKQRQPIFGAWTALADPSVAEIFSILLKPNFVGVDLEHSGLSLEECKNIFTAVQAKGCHVLPRVASHDKVQIRRLLDAGADGIIVPAVSNELELNNIVNSMKYPPLGTRGVGVYRAQGYGDYFEEYVSTWNNQSILLIIIENVEGLKNIEELASNEHVDGILIGEYDLKESFYTDGEAGSEKIQAAVSEIIDVCKRHKKSCGLLISEVNEEKIKTSLERVNFLILATDILILSEWSRKVRGFLANSNF